MELQIGKWGNSLALRLPSDVAREMGLREGARIELTLNDASQALLSPVRPRFDKAAYLRRTRELTDRMPMTDSVIDELRRGARY